MDLILQCLLDLAAGMGIENISYSIEYPIEILDYSTNKRYLKVICYIVFTCRRMPSASSIP